VIGTTAQAKRPIFLTLVLTFLLVFPKGGIKIGDVPLTWGYLFLLLGAVPFFFRSVQTVFRSHFQVFLALIPFQCVSIGYFLLFGIGNFGYGSAFIIHFIVFPSLFFFIFSKAIADIDREFFLGFLKKGIFFLAIYGICLSVFVHTFGFFFSIPFLTINFGDVGLLEISKCIYREGFFKLISTYNNGNIYGICLLMLMPLYLLIEESALKRQIVKLSLVLTLSRTIWVGLILLELFLIFKNYKKDANSFLKSILKFIIIFSLIILILFFLGKNLSFLLDPTLGGRSSEFSNFEQPYDHKPFQGLSEITYLSIYSSFGALGLITFLFGITSPIWTYYFFRSPSQSLENTKLNQAIMAGLWGYLILSCSDGAILYIPVMAFYWFLSAFLLI